MLGKNKYFKSGEGVLPGGIIILMILLFPAAALGFSVTAQVDKTRITPEETISFQVVVEGGEANVNIGSVQDFSVRPLGTSTSRSYTSGQWQHQVIYRYLLVPKKSGALVIPPLAVTQKNQTLKTREIKILSSKNPTGSGQVKRFFAKAETTADTFFLGQQILYTIKLYTAAKFTRASLELPEFEGFRVQELKNRKNYTQTINGINYLVNEIQYLLHGEKQGHFEIDPAVITAEILVPSGNDPFGSVFSDPFFGAGRTQTRRIASNPLTLKVLPLPSYSGKPVFSGLVGEFSLEAVLDTRELKPGDSATLTVTIQGNGNIMDAALPPMDVEGEFKIYDDAPVEDSKPTEKGFWGKKVFKRALVPKKTGQLTLPSLSLVYFDIKEKAYKTLDTTPIILYVQPSQSGMKIQTGEIPEAGNGLTGNHDPVDAGKQSVVMVNKDILDIKENLGILSSQSRLPFLYFSLLVAAPGCLFCIFYLVFCSRTRKKNAGQIMGDKARKMLKQAENPDSDLKAFVIGLHTALTAAILAKGDKAGQALTREEAFTLMENSSVDPENINRALEMMDRLDQARFGGMTVDSSLRRDWIRSVRQIIKVLGISCFFVIVLSFHSSPLMAAAQEVFPGTIQAGGAESGTAGVFVDGIRHYRAGEFSAAARSFESIAASGVVNPDLFFNIGNARLKAGDLGHAILWYERAMRLDPRGPDLAFNLEYADTLLKDKVDGDLTLGAVVMFWQGIVPVTWLRAAAVALSCVFFLVAGVRVVQRKKIFSGLARLVMAFGILFFLAAAMEEYRFMTETRAVILRDKVQVRSGTMEGATRLFDLNAGTRVWVKGEKKGYLKIKVARGKVGWIAPGDAQVI